MPYLLHQTLEKKRGERKNIPRAPARDALVGLRGSCRARANAAGERVGCRRRRGVARAGERDDRGRRPRGSSPAD